MKLKLTVLAVVFAAGAGASFALADGGHGNANGRCTEVHLKGTIAPQTVTVTVDRASHRLNVAPGAQVVLQVGAAGQTVRAAAEACQMTVGTVTTLLVRELQVKARDAGTTTTATTTAGTTTNH